MGLSYHADGNLELPGLLVDAEILPTQAIWNRFSQENKLTIQTTSSLQELKRRLKISPILQNNAELAIIVNIPLYGGTQYERNKLKALTFFAQRHVYHPTALFRYELNKQTTSSMENRLSKLSQKNPSKMKQHLLNAGGQILFLKSFYDIYRAEEGLDLFLGYAGLGYSFASQAIENGLIKKGTSKLLVHLGAHPIVQTGRLTTKLVLVRGVAGLAIGVFDVVDLGLSIQQLLKAEKGSKQWRDAIAGITISTVSLVSGAVLVIVAAPPGINLAVAFAIVGASMFYQGASTLAEYKTYRLTSEQEFRLFWHSTVGVKPPDDITHIKLQQDKINELVKDYENFLSRLAEKIVAVGFGTGDIVSHKRVTEADTDSECTPPSACAGRLASCKRDDRPERCFQKVEWWVSNEPTRSIISLHKKNFDTSLLPRVQEITYSSYLPASISSSSLWSLSLSSLLFLGYPPDESVIDSFYPCNSAFILGNSTRIQQMEKLHNITGIVLLDLSLINAGRVQGSTNYDTIFNIYSGNATLQGGYKINYYVVLNSTFIGSLEGSANSTDILDMSNLNSTLRHAVFYSNGKIRINGYSKRGIESFRRNPKLFTDNYFAITVKQLNQIIGRFAQPDYFDCSMDSAEHNEIILFNGLGGTKEAPDEISCQRAILSGYTNVKIKDDVFFNSNTSLVFHINFNQTGTINIDIGQHHFPVVIKVDDVHSIKQSTLNYFFHENYLTLAAFIKLPSDSLSTAEQKLTVKLKNYWNSASNSSNYIFVDEVGVYQLNPLINQYDPSVAHDPSAISLNFFLSGKIDHSFNPPEWIAKFNVFSVNNRVLSFIELSQGTEMPYCQLFIGSQGIDRIDSIPIYEAIDYAFGSEGSDIYLTQRQEIFPSKFNTTSNYTRIIIDNYANDKALDLLLLSSSIENIHLSIDFTQEGESLLINGDSLEKPILLKNYFVDEKYQHLAVQDIYGNFWMFYRKDNLVQNIPYYRQERVSLDLASVERYSHVAIETSDIDDWVYYQDGNDLLMSKPNHPITDNENFSVRVKDYYNYLPLRPPLTLLAVKEGTFVTEIIADIPSIKSHELSEQTNLAINSASVMLLLEEDLFEKYIYTFTALPKTIYPRQSSNGTSEALKNVIVQL